MDLRRPRRDWRKNPPSLTTTVSLLSLMLLLGGMCVSRSTAFVPTPAGLTLDASRDAHESSETLPDVFFMIGTGVAGLFILVYVLRIKEY